MTIDTLNPLVPADNIAVALVPDAIRDLVVAMQASFPSLVGASGLAESTTIAPVWLGTLTAETVSIYKDWNGIVTVNIFGTISFAFTTGVSSSSGLSNTDMTGFIPPAAAAGVPVLPAWGRTGGVWYLLGYITILSTGIVLYGTGSAPTATYDRLRVCGSYNVN